MEELNFRVCDNCKGKMFPQTMSKTFTFNGKEIEIRGIKGYRCENCGEELYDAKEIRMIDKLIRAMDDKPTVDILNLDETADYLRVSNQTVYNMIKSGRIKAYKVGREWKFLRSDIMAYLESASSDKILSMAAKGGEADNADLEIIQQELKKRKATHE